MSQTHLHDLLPGATLTRPVVVRGRTVFAAGRIISQIDLDKLAELGVTAVHADLPESNGNELLHIEADVLSPELREEAVNQIEQLYNDYEHLSAKHSQQIRTLASTLVREASRPTRLGIAVHDLRTHSNYTYRHCVNVTAIAIAVGVRLGYNETELNALALGGLMHDIGKMRVPAELLEKDGPLSPDEADVIHQHPVWGWELFTEMGGLSPVSAAVTRQHHELLDGSGYPEKLSGKAIHRLTRIITVVDRWDALRSDRPYKPAWAPDKILEYLFSAEQRVKLDEDVLSVFRALIVPYPVGSRIMLSGGRVAVVLAVHPDNFDRPLVYLENDPSGSSLDLRDRPALQIVHTLSVGDYSE